LLPSTPYYLTFAVQGTSMLLLACVFVRASAARRWRLRRSALFGRSVVAALGAAIGGGQGFVLWGGFGIP